MGKRHQLLDEARSGNIEQVANLLNRISRKYNFRRSSCINYQDSTGYTALHHACLNGHIEIVRLLLAYKSIPDIKDKRGSTPLYLASWAGYSDVVELLLNECKHLQVNVQTSDNETPLHCAAQHGHIEVLNALLKRGADPAIPNNSLQTPLDLSAHFGHMPVVQKLICSHPELLDPYRKQKISVNDMSTSIYANVEVTPKKFTHTCLHLASRNGHENIVHTLLCAGVDVNVMTNAGTALHEAALRGKQTVVRTLLRFGVNVNAVDDNGQTALDLLKNFPTHITYEIVSMIQGVNDKNNNCNFRPISNTSNKILYTEEGDDDDTDYEKEKQRKMPNILYDSSSLSSSPHQTKKLPSLAFSKAFKASGDSLAVSSLNRQKRSPASFYLEMKPVYNSESDLSDDKKQVTSIKPDFFNNINFDKGTKENLGKNGKGTLKSAKGEYVPMILSDTNKFSPKPSCRNVQNVEVKTKPVPIPRTFHINDHDKYRDYANLQIRSTPNDSDRATQTSNTTDDNIHHTHSPTPEFPPPTVMEAEHTILGYIQPNTDTSSKSKRSSLRLSERDELNLNAYLSKTSTIESRQSNLSDNVEEFVDDNPFAGLFKGSTFNLLNENDDKDRAKVTMQLRSPSLVRSVAPIPPKRKTVYEEQKFKNMDPDEVLVWDEINSILESIGNEFETEQSITQAEELENTIPETKQVKKNLCIRKPSHIQLKTSKNGADCFNWCHSPNTFIYGQILYRVFYLGSTVVKQLYGDLSTRKSIQKLKRNTQLSLEEELDASLITDCNNLTRILKENNQQKRLEVEISISCSGVRFIDVDNKSTISIHELGNIQCVCQDTENLRYFAYITTEKDIHYCHVFMVDNSDLAKEITLSLGQAFEVAFQLALSKANN